MLHLVVVSNLVKRTILKIIKSLDGQEAKVSNLVKRTILKIKKTNGVETGKSVT